MALPLPRVVPDVEAGGGFVTAAKGLNSLKKLKAEAQYAPYTEYANAMSKMAYGQTAPANAIATMLSSPAAANMDPALYNKLAQQANQSLSGYNPNMLPPPQNRGGMFGDSLVGNAVNALVSRFMPQAQQGQVPAGQAPAQGGATATGEAPQGGAQQPAGYNTNFSRQTAGVGVPGSMGVNNPTDVNAANRAAQNTTATGQAANQNELQKARSKMISQQATIATQALKLLEGFGRNYDKSSYKGQYIGDKSEKIPTLPGGTISPEQLANRYANEYLTTVSALGDTPAGQTDEGRSLIAAGKFDLSLDEGAKSEIVQSTKAKLNRMINSRDFATNFYKNNPGATDEELVGMMNAYNRYAPSYDYETGKALPQNDKKFRDFTSAQALNSYRDYGDYNPYVNKPSEGKTDKVFDLTGFENDKDFNAWYWKQNKDSRKQIDAQIKAGVY